MNNPLRTLFEKQIESQIGFEFEDFINELFGLLYGEEDFLPIRKTKDEGNDGIVKSKKMVIACYGPDKYLQRNADIKINDDFVSYSKNWKKNYPNWCVIINHAPTPFEVKLVEKLQKGTQILGLCQILNIIENKLKAGHRRKLGYYLKIDDEFFRRDYIEEMLRELLVGEKCCDSIEYTSSPEILKKIEVNFDPKDVDQVSKMYEGCLEVFGEIRDTLGSYEDNEINKIKSRVLSDFSSQSGDFKKKFNLCVKQYGDTYGPKDDDEYLFYARAILLYLFEQCLIGKKPN